MTITTNVAETADANLKRLAARRDRYAAQRVVWRETRLKRVALCGRTHASNAAGVALKLSGTPGTPDARAGFSGLQSCGSVWSCPVCAEKINASRQAELEAGITSWLSAGHAVLFGTLTLRHNRGHRLARLLDAIGPAWNRTTSGAGVQWNGSKRLGGEMGDKAMFGIVGYARVVETKHSADNGWHPHVHFLLFLERPISNIYVRDLEARMFARWEKALAARGLSVLRSVGIDLRAVEAGDDVEGSTLANYFTKGRYVSTPARAAYEVTGSQSKRLGKGGRSPFELLADLVRDGDADDLDLWHEWEQASRGRLQLTWSRGMRDRLKLEREKSDAEIVEEDAGGEVVFVFRADEIGTSWGANRWRWLEAAESGQLEQLAGAFLASRRRRRPPRRPQPAPDAG